MDYEEMLEKAYDELPEIIKEESRFQMPELESIVQGRVTVIQNFVEVTKALNRPPEVLSKYIASGTGTSGEVEGPRLILKGQFRPAQLQDKLEVFVEQYVMCPVCNRPDTKIIQENRISFLKCEACGARNTISTIKSVSEPKSQEKELAVGDELTVQITRTGKKGDGMAKHGKYIMFVNGSREGQTVKVKVAAINKTMAFADILQIL